MISAAAVATCATIVAPGNLWPAPAVWPPSRPTMVAAIILAALMSYALLGGADFGGGIWDLLASGPRRDAQRTVIARAIGPIWEANHVWLILAVVLLFTCFPPAFAQLGIMLHIPLAIMLIGIVLRGSAFSFRAYDVAHSSGQAHWGHVFAAASLLTPIFLGIVVGALASEDVGRAPSPASGAPFTATYIWPWLTPFAVTVGLFALSLFAFLAAVYLTVDAEHDGALQEDFRRRAIAAAAAVFVTAALTLAVARGSAPHLGAALVDTPSAWALHVVTACAALTAVAALLRRRFRLARAAAAAQVACIIAGWALAQYPYVIPPSLTINAAAAPRATLDAVVVALAVGAVILLPALAYLFWVVRGEPAAKTTTR